jgi:hypothetical protein
MTDSYESTALRFIGKFIHPAVVVERVLDNEQFYELVRSPTGIAITSTPAWEELADQNPKATILADNLESLKVALAIKEFMKTNRPAIQTLIEDIALNNQDLLTPTFKKPRRWSLTKLAQARVGDIDVFVGTGFESLPTNKFHIAISQPSDRNALLGYELNDGDLLQALADNKSIFVEAVCSSPNAFAKLCELDSAFIQWKEHEHISAVTGPGTPTRLPQRL